MRNLILLIAFLPLYVKSQCTTQFDKVTEENTKSASVKIFKKFTDRERLTLTPTKIYDDKSEKYMIGIVYFTADFTLGTSVDSLFLKLSDKTLLKLPAIEPYGEAKQIGKSDMYNFTCRYLITKEDLEQLKTKDISIVRIHTMKNKFFDVENLPKSSLEEFKKAVDCVLK